MGQTTAAARAANAWGVLPQEERKPARYIDTAEVAKLMRKRLKAAFPRVKFSVRISRYAGGSSIDVSWTDGPTEERVKALGDFDGKGFDGMIDLEYSIDHWLNPETGEAVPARSSGTEGSRGIVSAFQAPPPWPNAELVHFLGGYHSYNRHYSKTMLERAARWAQEELGEEVTVKEHVHTWKGETSTSYELVAPRWSAPRGYDGSAADVARRKMRTMDGPIA